MSKVKIANRFMLDSALLDGKVGVADFTTYPLSSLKTHTRYLFCGIIFEHTSFSINQLIS